MAENLQLIHLSQINGGLTLKAAIEALQASYPADHVTTRISKGEGANESYNVEELLLLLKTIVDTQLGNSEGSVAERLEILKTELQNNIDAINNREVKDRVKVAGTIDAAGTMTLADYSGVTALDKAIDYIVYYENNKPVRDADGKNVTYNFGTGILSDTPHVRQVSVVAKGIAKEPVPVGADKRTFDLVNINIKQGTLTPYHKDAEGNYKVIDPSEFYINTVSGKVLFKADQIEEIFVDYQYEISELSFVSLVGAASIKLFPIGTFKFAQLPREYLLDNTELNLIAYSEVIDELVLSLASDKELVDHIISLIGTEAVQNAIISMTEALQKRVSALEGVALNLGQAYKDADAILDKKFIEKDIDRQNDIMDVNNRIDEMKSTTPKTDEFVALSDQTAFELSAIPAAKLVKLRVNCIEYVEGKHFTVDRAALRETDPDVFVAAPTLTWTFTAAANGFNMVAGMDIEACYEVKAVVTAPVHILYPA
jgi:hypothetical protein